MRGAVARTRWNESIRPGARAETAAAERAPAAGGAQAARLRPAGRGDAALQPGREDARPVRSGCSGVRNCGCTPTRCCGTTRRTSGAHVFLAVPAAGEVTYIWRPEAGDVGDAHGVRQGDAGALLALFRRRRAAARRRRLTLPAAGRAARRGARAARRCGTWGSTASPRGRRTARAAVLHVRAGVRLLGARGGARRRVRPRAGRPVDRRRAQPGRLGTGASRLDCGSGYLLGASAMGVA